MAFDQPTRNRLARFVGDARALLTEEFTRQLQHDYGLDPSRGEVAPLERLAHLDDARHETARILRATLAHYLAGESKPSARTRQQALERIVREQAFTVLNRLCALRLAEARDLIIESVGQGYQSRGFQLYARLAGAALGETGDAYRAYLFSLFDEFALDLAVLFDRFSPQGRLFPRDAVLAQLLDLINHPDLEPLWAEDETIGWIYQYFNSQEERRQMRAESQAPRNSRELAVRNQFFTPRYVVEFLTDNTLGRIWYEMTRGETRLAEQCRYLVRRPKEIFLDDPGDYVEEDCRPWVRKARDGDFSELPDDPNETELSGFALAFDGYEVSQQQGYGDLIWSDRQLERYRREGVLPDSSLALWFIFIRQQRYWGRATIVEEGFLDEWRAVYAALRDALQREQQGEGLSQEELLNQPVYIPHRPHKDPRELRLLDPACGSMHFGLYAFDLFEVIYEEAWERGWIRATDLGLDGMSGAEAYQNFRRQIPRLIIEHNLHGIDIDPRAVQIAGLSLWLRAQRSWQVQGLTPQDRPVIRKSNIVCAEPMPGDQTQLAEFLKGLREERLESLIRRVLDVPEHQRVRATPTMADALCELVSTIWHEMELAGEAGSLLKIEESLAAAIDHARNEWEQRLPLFRVETFRMTEGRAEKPQINYWRNLPGEEPMDFWDRAEALVLAALEEYAQQAENGGGYARRLFAADAARGFAFIDLCRKQYDVVLMNPPFGEFARDWKSAARNVYPNSANDILAAFVDSFLHRLYKRGRVGAITSRTCFFLTSFADWRTNVILQDAALNIVADLGQGVMDAAMVEAAAYVIERSQPIGAIPFIRAITDRERNGVLDACITAYNVGRADTRMLMSEQQVFDLLPSSPFIYWIDRGDLHELIHHETFEHEVGDVRQGLATGDDPRFVRTIWEVPAENTQFVYFPSDGNSYCRLDDRHVLAYLRRKQYGKPIWAFHVKAGSSQPWFSPITLKINWHRDGSELRNFRNENGRLRSRPQNISYYYRPGFSWTRRAARLYPYAIPRNCIPSVSRYMAFPHQGREYEALGVCASRIASAFMRFYGEKFEWPNFLVETMKKLPWPDLGEETKSSLHAHIREEVNSRRHAYQNHEPFQEFLTPMKVSDFSREGRALAFDPRSLLGEQLEQRVAYAYGLSAEAAQRVERDVLEAVAYQFGENSEEPADSADEDGEADDDSFIDISEYAQTESLLSYTLGCAVGRWDIRYATGERQSAPLPDPFDPLPVCPPGMLQNADGLPATPADVPADYPLRISWPGILVDDPGHAEDIVGRVREALAVIWPHTHDAIEQEACEILGVDDLRAYFANPNKFFDDHLKRYSKSRRSAPIYWPLSTSSGSYTLWLYYHRLSDQMLYTCINDFVDPKLAECRRQVDALQARQRSSAEEKELERLTDLAAELQEFRAELLRIAQFWRPNLNDGVQITAAPLWRLFRHRQWQRRLQETWEKLESGDYDWAHLALSIWPERVVPKCLNDRSLAIAHDVEELFWVEDEGSWRKLAAPAAEIAAQHERHRERLPAKLRERVLKALAHLAGHEGRGMSGQQIAQHLAEGDWDDTEIALLFWPERVAEACLDDPFLADRLRINLPAKRTQAARKRFVKQLVDAGCPDLASALVATLADEAVALETILADLHAGRRDAAPLALSLWPERVIDRAVEDVDLAAAHDLRRFLWVQTPDGAWRRRVDPKQEVVDEVRRRSG